jgi:hypothetical protein
MGKRFSLIWAAAVSFAALACAPQQSKDFGPYSSLVDKFVTDAKAHQLDLDSSHLVVKVAELSSTTTQLSVSITETTRTEGDCDPAGPTVTISAHAASTFGPESLEALVYHELGHCLLSRQHLADTKPDGTPVSLMNPQGVPGDVYYAARDEYLAELFGTK